MGANHSSTTGSPAPKLFRRHPHYTTKNIDKSDLEDMEHPQFSSVLYAHDNARIGAFAESTEMRNSLDSTPDCKGKVACQDDGILVQSKDSSDLEANWIDIDYVATRKPEYFYPLSDDWKTLEDSDIAVLMKLKDAINTWISNIKSSPGTSQSSCSASSAGETKNEGKYTVVFKELHGLLFQLEDSYNSKVALTQGLGNGLRSSGIDATQHGRVKSSKKPKKPDQPSNPTPNPPVVPFSTAPPKSRRNWKCVRP